MLSEDVRSRLKEHLTSRHVTPRAKCRSSSSRQKGRDKAIAEAIGISQRTVYVHMHNILAKLDARDRTEAVRTAVRRRIIRMIRGAIRSPTARRPAAGGR